jgi:hypothetical protein
MKVKMEANSPPPADLVEDANPSRRMKVNEMGNFADKMNHLPK